MGSFKHYVSILENPFSALRNTKILLFKMVKKVIWYLNDPFFSSV